jgi:hypothetical protein
MSSAMSLVGIWSAVARNRRRGRARQTRSRVVEEPRDREKSESLTILPVAQGTPESLALVLLILCLEYHLILNVRSQ